MILKSIGTLSVLLAAALIVSCAPEPKAPASTTGVNAAPRGKLHVVATFSTLGAIVADVGGDRVAVMSLVPIGAAPETYEPAPSDLVALEHADLIFENGGGLETFMDHLLRSVSPGERLIALAPDAAIPDTQARPNPHFWLDPTKASEYAQKIASALERVDPANAATYRRNVSATTAKYADLDQWIAAQVATIPPDRRAMICFHDAWYYYDKRYGIIDVGAVEPTPGQEPSAGAFAQLIADARRYHVRAVFAEPQFSPKLAQQLADGAGITTVTDLYDDTLGDTPEL